MASTKVKFRKINWKTIVKAVDPKPEKPVVYRFSNGRTFKDKKRG